jgi:hypothetical protein
MQTQFKLGHIKVDVAFKDIKNVHLSVYPPNGAVRISAPNRMKVDTVRVFAISKLDWIKRQQKKLRSQDREAPRDYITKESHYLFGERYILQVNETSKKQSIELKHRKIVLNIKPNTSKEKKELIFEGWYKEQLAIKIQPMLLKWEKKLKCKAKLLRIRKMKTKWGNCDYKNKAITLNLELAKKPLDCIEYIIVHEMAHLIEPNHSDRFIAIMNNNLPQWRFFREKLNMLPIRYN